MKLLVIIGTRPEAIKMAPIVKELEKRKTIQSLVCVTGQHRQMLDQVLDIFNIEPDYDLDIFSPGQSLSRITSQALAGIEEVIHKEKPDLMLVQGDTTTVFAGALAAFYNRVKLGHVEAGLRTGNIYFPYPEEANRKMVSAISHYHFCPTDANAQTLLDEGYPKDRIFTVGNTVIDALRYTVDDQYEFEDETLSSIDFDKEKVILLTTHRRENIGKPMEEIFRAIRDELADREDARVVFPIHLNPKVREIAYEAFEGFDKVDFVEPLDYLPFTNLMSKSYMVMTDSGGVQEEGPSLAKPILVLREETERMEGVQAGTAVLVGSDYEKIRQNVARLLDDRESYDKMARAQNPYGDGTAARQIVDIIEKM